MRSFGRRTLSTKNGRSEATYLRKRSQALDERRRRRMTARKKKTDDVSLKAAVLAAALKHAPFDGFTDKVLDVAGKEAGADKVALARLFPEGPLSLVEAFSESADDAMEAALAKQKLG